MLKKRIIISLTFNDGVLFRTKKFKPDYRYTKNFVDLWNADEIILIDVSDGSNKQSQNFLKVVNFFIENCHLPITVGGGIDSLKKAKKVFELGVEKIIVNSSSYTNPQLTSLLASTYGSSSIVHSIDCKKSKDNKLYDIYINNGKTKVDQKSLEYLKKILSFNVGEILINNIDNDGSLLGYDLELINFFANHINIPLIVQGGAGNWEHFYEVLKLNNISGACTQNIYHFTEKSLISLKMFLKEKKINIRLDDTGL